MGLLECYCKADLPNRLNQYFTITTGANAQDLQLCQNWFQKDLFMNLLPILIVIAIVFLNMIMQTLFKGIFYLIFYFYKRFLVLSSIEKHKYLSAELASRVVKIFIAQFLNTGMILLIMNIRFTDGSSIAQNLQTIIKGKYYDFDPLWFEGVGTVILLTMFINIFSTPIIVVLFHVLRLIKRCLDQSILYIFFHHLTILIIKRMQM